MNEFKDVMRKEIKAKECLARMKLMNVIKKNGAPGQKHLHNYRSLHQVLI